MKKMNSNSGCQLPMARESHPVDDHRAMSLSTSLLCCSGRNPGPSHLEDRCSSGIDPPADLPNILSLRLMASFKTPNDRDEEFYLLGIDAISVILNMHFWKVSLVAM